MTSSIKHLFNFLENGNLVFVDKNGQDYDWPEGPNWDQRFKECLRNELAEIFKDDGNPMPEAVFIAGLPGSWLGILAICGWKATFGMPALPLGSELYMVPTQSYGVICRIKN